MLGLERPLVARRHPAAEVGACLPRGLQPRDRRGTWVLAASSFWGLGGQELPVALHSEAARVRSGGGGVLQEEDHSRQISWEGMSSLSLEAG